MDTLNNNIANRPPWQARYVFISFISISLFLTIVTEISKTRPNSSFINYYCMIFAFCVVIYVLNAKYPLNAFSSVDLRKTSKYGFLGGVVLLAEPILNSFRKIPVLPSDLNIFAGYEIFLRIVFLINLILITPIVEEILFRGFYYRILKNRYNIIIGGVISIILFAIGHEIGISAFLQGIVLTIVYEKTKSIWSSIITHILINTFQGIKYVFLVSW